MAQHLYIQVWFRKLIRIKCNQENPFNMQTYEYVFMCVSHFTNRNFLPGLDNNQIFFLFKIHFYKGGQSKNSQPVSRILFLNIIFTSLSENHQRFLKNINIIPEKKCTCLFSIHNVIVISFCKQECMLCALMSLQDQLFTSSV